MNAELRSRVALVTGASRGLGRAIAQALAVEGYRLALVARDQTALEETSALISQSNVEVMYIAADLTVPEEIERIGREVLARYGRVDVLVHNAGGARGQDIFDTSEEDWHAALALNVTALSHLSRLIVPGMRERGGGRIIAISSIFGRESGGRTPYNALKAASISLTKSLARQLAPQNILVNSIAPGSLLFPGSSWERRLKADPEGMQVFIQNELPLGRFGKPEEVAAVVAFLASPAASLVTGACLPVDGAQSRSNI